MTTEYIEVYKNHETFLVATWIFAENDIFQYLKGIALKVEFNPILINLEARQSGVYIFADRIKDWFESRVPKNRRTILDHLLNSAIQRIDWEEISENFLIRINITD